MVPNLKLNNNCLFPAIGMGAFKASNIGASERVLQEAIDIGYRHFDSAMFYTNEKEIGAAIKAKILQGVIKREDVFVTTKLWNNHHRPDMVLKACKKSLTDLDMDYVDLFLIHWPIAFKDGDDGMPKDESGNLAYSDVDYVDTWKAMEECVKLGFAKGIGVSNFNSEQIQRILDIATIKPVVNQIECHPYLNQTKMIAFCKEKGIVCTGYSAFGGITTIAPHHQGESPEPLKDEKIKELAEKYGKSVGQIILRYMHQHGIVPIQVSANKKRLQENIDIFNFELKPEDVAVMDSLNRDKRICDWIEVKDHKHYPFNIEF